MSIRERIFMFGLAALLLSASALPAKGPAESGDQAKEGETVQTPFGPAKKRSAESAPKPAKGPSMVDVKIEGDTAKFSRKTPFGVQSWTRKLSELSAAEKELVEEAEQASKPAPAKEDAKKDASAAPKS